MIGKPNKLTKRGYYLIIVNKTQGEGQMYTTLLLQLCDLVAPVILVYAKI